MIFSQSQFYDIVQYAKSKNLDPKIFTHEIIDKETTTNFWGKKVEVEISEHYSLIGIKSTEYYFKVDLNLYNYFREDRMLNTPSSYTLFGDRTDAYGNERKGYHNIYFHIHFSPGEIHFHTTHKRAGFQNHFSWINIFEYAKIWVDNLVDEIHAIESLSRINLIPDFFSSHREFEYGQQSYSGYQGEQLKEKIKLLKTRVLEEIPMTEDQSKIINEKLDELIKKVDTINKFDYRTFFFGILTNIASSVLYDNAPNFWNIVKGVFGNTMIGNNNTDLLI